jgi:hypothetical protein
MTALREGLGEPLVELPPATVDELRAFLDGQSRVKAAAWARHLEPGNPPDAVDHHILLALADEDWTTGDIVALDDAIPLPFLGVVGATWQDFFPVSELPEVRTFATMLWEQTTPGSDPLDYRYTYEPFAVDDVDRFAARLGAEPAIRRVHATLQTLWNGDELVEERVQLFVGAQPMPHATALDIVMDAARATILAGRHSYGATLGCPSRDAAVLYEAAA